MGGTNEHSSLKEISEQRKKDFVFGMSIGFEFYESFSDEMKRVAFHHLQSFVETCWGAKPSESRGVTGRDAPFFIARMSGIEMGEMGRYYEHRDFSMVRTDLVQKHSGIWVVNEESWVEYVNRMHLALASCDRLAIWDGECYRQCREMYDYCRRVFVDTYTFPAHALEPYYFMNETCEYRWDRVFEGRRVLIVTSHASSVAYQLGVMDRVFHPYTILPSPDDVIVYRTVQQSGMNGDGQDWRIHFERMCADIRGLVFDVALIGCGGFSNLLGHFIRAEMGRSAIYVGGPLQLFFGIMGRRWTMNREVMALVQRNIGHWIRPLPDDYIHGHQMVDDSSYWW